MLRRTVFPDFTTTKVFMFRSLNFGFTVMVKWRELSILYAVIFSIFMLVMFSLILKKIFSNIFQVHSCNIAKKI